MAFSNNLIQPGQLDMQHIAVQKQQRGLGLILGGRCDLSFHRQIAQEALNFIGSHILGVALVVEQDETTCPFDISFLSADTVVTHTNLCAHPVEQLGRILRNDFSFHPWNFRLP
jgi:hypothetical protein